jgi:hypothetical protein
MLAPELPMRQLSISQRMPKQGFGTRLPLTEMLRALDEPLHLRLSSL